MSTNIPAVQNTAVLRTAEFVRLSLKITDGTTPPDTRIIGFSTSYRTETINNITYPELGALLGIGNSNRDLAATESDTTISITGLNSLYLYFVAGGPATSPIPITTRVFNTTQSDIGVGFYPLIKGSEIQIYRGFYNSQQQFTSSSLRYTGLVTSYTVQETRSEDNIDDIYTIQLNCSSYRTVLERRLSGRKTNAKSWRYFNPTDSSMDRVVALQNQLFDFGKAVNSGSPSDAGYVDPSLSGGV